MFRTLAPALVAPLLVLTACATESDDAAVEVRTGPAAVATLRAVPDEAAEAGTGAFEIVMEMTVDGQSLALVTTGAFDRAANRTSMSTDMGALFEQIARATGEDVPSGLGGVVSVVVDGDTYYVRTPALDTIVGRSGWFSFDAGDLGVAQGELGLSSLDPASILEALRGVGGEPTIVGTEDVRGVETTRYAATVDLDRAVEQVPGPQRAQVEAQLDQLGDAEVAVDVWVGADGLARRLRLDMGGLAAMAFGEEGEAVMTMELFDYGQPVDIQPPAPDEVSSLPDLFGWSAGNGS